MPFEISLGMLEKTDFFAKKPRASDQAKSPHSAQGIGVNALCRGRAVIFVSSLVLTRLIVSMKI